MDFFCCVPPSLIRGSQCTTCGQKGHHFEVCLKQYTYCIHCEHYGHYSRNYLMKKLTPSELGSWLFKRQVEDDTLSQAMSHCSQNGSPTDTELRKASHPVEQISESSWRSNQCMNIKKAAQNTAQTPLDQKHYNGGERGHCFNGCPNPRIHLPFALITNTAPTSSKKTTKVCFHCDQSGHFALQCPDRRQ
jgi:hypothetical protein